TAPRGIPVLICCERYLVLLQLGRPDETMDGLARAREILGGVVAADPGDIQAQSGLALTCLAIGGLRRAAGDRDGALASVRRGVEILRKYASSDPDNLYNLACGLAQCSALVGSAPGATEADRAAGRRDADRAMDALRLSVENGFGNVELMGTDRDL